MWMINMNIQNIKSTLSNNFHDLTQVAPHIFRATQVYMEKPFAVKYFDLSNDIHTQSKRLDEYLDDVLSKDFFDEKRPIDLRWNNYLYFVTNDDAEENNEYLAVKNSIESNKEYARKFVVKESELEKLLSLSSDKTSGTSGASQDIYATWISALNEKNIGYLLDFDLSIPKAVSKIANGELGRLESLSEVSQLNCSEQLAVTLPIEKLTKKGFRNFPRDGEYTFGSHVNLITGPNGHGKTSLLESIEYLFCGSTKRNETTVSSSISGTFIGEKEALETTSAKKYAKRLKARNLVWYGKNDVRGSTLDDSFSRFNFMDTDAAVRVSVDGSSVRLSEDISRIVLGAEAGKALDRVSRL